MARAWLLAALCMLAACSGLAGDPEIVATIPPATTAPQDMGFPSQPPDLAAGAQVYAANCTRCHGIGGAGDGELTRTGQVRDPGVFTDPTAARPQIPRQWFDTITAGRLERLMPPWGDVLSEQDRWNVAYFTYTLHYQPEQIASGQAVWEAAALPLDPADLQAMTALSDQALYDQLAAAQPAASADALWAAVVYARSLGLANADTLGQQPVATEEAAVMGDVTGRVLHGTALGTVPPELTVILFASDGTQLTQRLETVTDSNGFFRFEGVTLTPDQSYIAVTTYQERTFTSAFVRGESDTLDLPITLYELTEDPAVITIIGVVSQITAVGEGLQVVQVFNVRNDSDRMFTTSQPIGQNQFASLVISLPPGAVIIGFPDNEQRYVIADDQATVIDTSPVLPGSDHIVQMVWFLPYQDGAIIEQGVNYALSGPVRLLLRPDTVTASSEQLEPIGPQQVGETVYTGYGGTLTLAAGDSILYELSGTGVATAAEVEPQTVSPNNLVVAVIIVVVAQVVLIGGLYLYYRRRRAAAPDPAVLIDALMQQIAELDDQHDRGQINHDLYHHRRQQLKARLAELTGQQEP